MDSSQGKKCNFCGEGLLNDTKRCPYCGSLMTNINEGSKNSSETYIAQDDQQNKAVSLEKKDDINTDALEKGYENDRDVVRGQETLANVMGDEVGIYKEINSSSLDNKKTVNESMDSFEYYDDKRSLSNGMKVFIVAISSFIPGIGQLVGIIAAIVFMNNEKDKDRKSFGIALLITSLIIFVLSFCLYCVVVMAISGKGK